MLLQAGFDGGGPEEVPMHHQEETEKQKQDEERSENLRQLESWLERPMIILGFIWLALLVVEFLGEGNPFLTVLNTVIWVLFIIEFSVRFALSTHKASYFKHNWITVLSLAAPALRIFRIARFFRIAHGVRLARGARLLRFISSVNRSMRILQTTMGRRGFGYILLLTIIIVVSGAAGMHAFERDAPSGPDFKSYAASLWWTAMIMTTMGSQYWPVTAEGRLLCLLLAIYAFTVFGYVTAVLATFFIGLDAEERERGVDSAGAIEDLRREVASLRREIQTGKKYS